MDYYKFSNLPLLFLMLPELLHSVESLQEQNKSKLYICLVNSQKSRIWFRGFWDYPFPFPFIYYRTFYEMCTVFMKFLNLTSYIANLYIILDKCDIYAFYFQCLFLFSFYFPNPSKTKLIIYSVFLKYFCGYMILCIHIYIFVHIHASVINFVIAGFTRMR